LQFNCTTTSATIGTIGDKSAATTLTETPLELSVKTKGGEKRKRNKKNKRKIIKENKQKNKNEEQGKEKQEAVHH